MQTEQQQMSFKDEVDEYFSMKIGMPPVPNSKVMTVIGVYIVNRARQSDVDECGCKLGERFIGVEGYTTGAIYDKPMPDRDGYPKEIGIDQSKIPSQDSWTVLPSEFKGVPVYYCFAGPIYEL